MWSSSPLLIASSGPMGAIARAGFSDPDEISTRLHKVPRRKALSNAPQRRIMRTSDSQKAVTQLLTVS
jgi:hypothetical protein